MFDLDPDNLILLLIRMPIILLALTVHEYCHGYFAYRMGDPTAYQQGRLSLNPLRHLDPLGTICLMFASIGWAKPVPINALNFRNRRKGILVTTAAGPASNLVQAILFALAIRAIIYFSQGTDTVAHPHVSQFILVVVLMCEMAVGLNVCLAVFNCLPLYPLDGFHVTLQLMRPESRQRFAETAHFGPYAIIGLIVLPYVANINILGSLIRPPVMFIMKHVAGV